MPGKMDNIRLTCDKLREDAPRIKGQSAHEGPQTSGSRDVDHIGEIVNLTEMSQGHLG